MGIFDKKTDEEKRREKIVKDILGGFTWTSEVGGLFKKYDRGTSPEQGAWRQTKQEAMEGKIQPDEYLSRLEELLSELPTKEETDLIKSKKLNDSQKEKIKELTGGILNSVEFIDIVKGIDPKLNAGTIQSELKDQVTLNNTPVDKIEDVLDDILDNKYYTQKENIIKQEQLKKEDEENKKRIKEEQKLIKQKEEINKKILFHDEMSDDELRQGIRGDQLNMAKQEETTGLLNFTQIMSFNAFQQFHAKIQKAQVDQNKSIIRQLELQQRTIDELKETNKEILNVLKTLGDRNE